MTVFELLIVMMPSILIGILIAAIYQKKQKPKEICGNLLVYEDEDDGPYFFLDLLVEPKEVKTKKQVLFDVKLK